MYNKKKSVVVRFVALVLIAVMLLPMGVSAAVQPRASYYLDAYSAYVYAAGSGKIRVYFDVSGTGYMDEIGALSIKIYESTDNSNWTRVVTRTHDSTSGMLSYDDDYHSGYVTYSGVAGRYYKAYVCVWAGANDDGDTRYFWTSAKKAT